MLPPTEDPLDSSHRLPNVLTTVEGRQANIPLPRRAEAAARRAYDGGAVQELVEKAPGIDPLRASHPDIRGICPPEDRQPRRFEGTLRDGGVLKVEADQVSHLLAPLIAVGGLRAALDDVGNSVGLRRLAAAPEPVEKH